MTAEIIYEVSLSTRSSREETSDLIKVIFINLGFQQSQMSESLKGTCLTVSVFVQGNKKAESLARKIKRLKLKRCFLSVKKLKKKDWRDEWKKSFKHFPLTGCFEVVPVWMKEKYKGKRDPVYIDTVSAFGTGKHDTTRFIVELIESRRGKFESFFDIGTGTGILSIIAKKCGAKKICAVDIDPDCIKESKENLASNKCCFDDIRVADIGALKNSQKFDFVAANLNSFDLIRLKRKIFSYVKPNKFLAISGISIENLKKCHGEFKHLPLKCLKIKKGKQWASILYKRI